MNVFADAWYILFPKKISRKYSRDRLGRFSIKQFKVIYIGDDNWKQLIGEHMENYE